MKTKILAHSREPRGNELIIFQAEISTYTLLNLLKSMKEMEITWSDLEFGGFVRTYEVTITTSDIALEKFFEKCCPKYFINKDIPPWGIEKKVNQNKTTPQPLQELAEEMYDLYNESEAVELKEGEWHLPSEEVVVYELVDDSGGVPDRYNEMEIQERFDDFSIAISVTLLSNPNETDYNELIQIHDQLIENNELDTFVHCARVMTDEEYNGYVKGKMPNKTNHSIQVPTKDMFGYCDNYRGFISYKNIIKNN